MVARSSTATKTNQEKPTTGKNLITLVTKKIQPP